MLDGDDYELIDFGNGRKLERFGPYRLDRPSPAAEGIAPRSCEPWRTAVAQYERGVNASGIWAFNVEVEMPWRVRLGRVSLELKLTEFGHLGIFPEQASNWQWIDEQVRLAGRPKILNLFAYTGASTLVAAAAGAEVVHVDSAANVVAWARRNAQLSGLADAPIRWLVEDAQKFVRRELKRGQSYDAVILDPPAYGHGPTGKSWKIEDDLPELLAMCFQLCGGQGRFVLLSCHSGNLASAEGLLSYVRQLKLLLGDLRPVACPMELSTASGSRLHSGATVRWSTVRDR